LWKVNFPELGIAVTFKQHRSNIFTQNATGSCGVEIVNGEEEEVDLIGTGKML
jgi:hypothetical protein